MYPSQQVNGSTSGKVFEPYSCQSSCLDPQADSLARDLGRRAEYVVNVYAVAGGFVGAISGIIVAEQVGGGLVVCALIFLALLAIGTEFGKSRRLDFKWKQAMLRRYS